MPKRGHLWPIWWRDKSTLTKQLFCFSYWIIFDFKIEIIGKNRAEKHPHIIVFMFGSRTNEFGRVWTKKIRIWRKSWKGQKVLEIFSKTFWPFDLFWQTKFWKKKLEKGRLKKRQRINDFAFLLLTTQKYSSFNHPYVPKRTLKFFLDSIPACSGVLGKV